MMVDFLPGKDLGGAERNSTGYQKVLEEIIGVVPDFYDPSSLTT